MKKKENMFIDPTHFTKEELAEVMMQAYVLGERNGKENALQDKAERYDFKAKTKRAVEACESLYKPLLRKYNKEYYDSIDEIIIE
ncbi:MAG: hypothetical protein H8E55_03500 [Pelagibacterales bacterium]|nr:hypothetical protein [Pelagibacterales bacterium]